MTVRASKLISVQWPPEPVSEGPDTLVLSVGTYYVDLRVSRHDGSIYWALAGRRIVVSEDPRKVRFTHEFDSHQPHRNTVNKNDEKNKGEEEEDEEVADEGEFTKLPNGDDLEIGEMPAPHLGGKVSPYREIWRELKIGFDDEEGNQDDDTGKETCWIIESLNDAQKRTFYCKVGKFFLALRRTERRHLSEEGNNEIGKEIEFSAIRQELISKTDEQTDEHWVTKYSIGTDADDMFHMSRSSSDFVLENINGKSAWGVDDQVVVRNKGDGSIREVCVVRAVN